MFSRNTTKLTSFGAAALERAEPLVEQLHRPVVDVEIELEARAEQDVARVAVVGHARIAERADEDRVELPRSSVVAVRRNRDAGLRGSGPRSTAGARARTCGRTARRRAVSTFTASAVTSLPMPSPGMTAIRMISCTVRHGSSSRLRLVTAARSFNAIAIPIPPLTHSVASPRRASRRCIS